MKALIENVTPEIELMQSAREKTYHSVGFDGTTKTICPL